MDKALILFFGIIFVAGYLWVMSGWAAKDKSWWL